MAGLTLFLLLCSTTPASAVERAGVASHTVSASADTIVGRVADSAAPLADVTVNVRSATTLELRTARTDSNGVYRVVFASTSAAYEIVAQRIGWKAGRIRIERGPQGFAVPIIVLRRNAAALADVQIVAKRPQVSLRQGSITREQAANSQDAPPNGALQDVGGDVGRLGASVPGALLVPGADGESAGFSVQGAGPTGNTVTLEGLRIDASAIPSLALQSARVTTAAYDGASGSFRGAQVAVSAPLQLDYTNAYAWLRYTDPTWQSGPLAARDVLLASNVNGPLAKRWSYSAATDVSLRTMPRPSLFGASPSMLRSYALDADTVRRLEAVLDSLGVPTPAGPASLQRRMGKMLSTLRYTGAGTVRAATIRVDGASDVTSGLGFSARSSAIGKSSMRQQGGGVGATVIATAPRGLTSATSAYLSLRTSRLETGTALPSARVVLETPFGDSGSAASSVQFGGAGGASAARTTGWQLRQEFSRMSMNRAHRLELTFDAIGRQHRVQRAAGESGAFAFASLSDLAAGRPTFYTRTFASSWARAETRELSMALTDTWIHSPSLLVVGSLRLEHAAYETATPYDSTVAATFGLRTDRIPSQLDVTPRIGFYWTPVNRVRQPLGRLNGGIGIYREPLTVQRIAAMGGGAVTRMLACVGSDVPAPDWEGYLQGIDLPSVCASGVTSTSGDTARRTATAYDASFHAPWATKATLTWRGRLPRAASLTIDGTLAWHRAEASLIDRNIQRTPTFVLASEANRPVYVPVSAIDTASGTVDAGAARLTDAVGPVRTVLSDGKTIARVLTMRLSPRLWNPDRAQWELAYTWSHIRALTRDGGADPWARTWGPSIYERRHQVQLAFADVPLIGNTRLNVLARLTSGAPFTPIVDQDVNGDGIANDAAYISAANVPDLALLTSRTAARCLRAVRGRIVPRGACRGPWSASADLSLAIPFDQSPSRPSRIYVRVSNVLGVLDWAAHGGRRTGWGDEAFVDPVLLSVRGFEPGTQRYRYAVNPTFGTVRRGALLQAPIKISVEVMRQLSRPVIDMQAERTLQRLVLGDTSERVYGVFRQTASSRYQYVLSARDDLVLTQEQIDRISRLDTTYQLRFHAAVRPYVLALSQLPRNAPAHEVRAILEPGQATDHALQRDAAIELRKILTEDQWALVSHHMRNDAERAPASTS